MSTTQVKTTYPIDRGHYTSVIRRCDPEGHLELERDLQIHPEFRIRKKLFQEISGNDHPESAGLELERYFIDPDNRR